MKLNEIRQTNGFVAQGIGDQAQVKIVFEKATGERLMLIKRAEELLSEAGVKFETGYHLNLDRRIWQFDWSLEGASVVYKGPGKADRIMVVTVEYGAKEEEEQHESEKGSP